MQYNFTDNLFQEYITSNILDMMHKLDQEYSSLDEIYLEWTSANNTFIHDSFIVEPEHTSNNEDLDSEDLNNLPILLNGETNISDLSFNYFRIKLVEYFDILFHKNVIIWLWKGKSNKYSQCAILGKSNKYS